MSRLLSLRHQHVECMPEQLDQGVLYISKRFRTASHLCCCGCGLKVVTPLNAAKWTLIDHGTCVSLTPSIGNWNFPCHSHYLIIRNGVRWAEPFSSRKISAVQRRDQKDVARLASGRSIFVQASDVLMRWFK